MLFQYVIDRDTIFNETENRDNTRYVGQTALHNMGGREVVVEILSIQMAFDQDYIVDYSLERLLRLDFIGLTPIGKAQIVSSGSDNRENKNTSGFCFIVDNDCFLGTTPAAGGAAQVDRITSYYSSQFSRPPSFRATMANGNQMEIQINTMDQAPGLEAPESVFFGIIGVVVTLNIELYE
jgi:hypothetical protein